MALEPNKTTELVALICWLARENRTTLTTVQLVKYLYLADLYVARERDGATLTAWPWAFVHFGPYCTEAMVAIDAAVARHMVVQERYESKYEEKDFSLFRALGPEAPAVANDLPQKVYLALRRAIKKWADDTAGLLDHVYFETEPMTGIEPGDRLDFSRARQPEPVAAMLEPQALSVKKIKKGRELIQKLRTRTFAAAPSTPLDTGPHDDEFLATLHADEDGDIPDMEGTFDVSSLRGTEVDE